jgi:[phosphatase 2A protein]-leucine-carboxy methyltransferase
VTHRHSSSAVNAGYLSDPYAASITKISPSTVSRRVPLINLGTHHRTWALDQLVTNFLNCRHSDGEVKKKQIVSLGAGSDTRFWRLMVSNVVRSIGIQSTEM